jgi:hypothetical protein
MHIFFPSFSLPCIHQLPLIPCLSCAVAGCHHMLVISFIHSFFKERKIDWHDLKGNTKELKRKEILMYKVEEN